MAEEKSISVIKHKREELEFRKKVKLWHDKSRWDDNKMICETCIRQDKDRSKLDDNYKKYQISGPYIKHDQAIDKKTHKILGVKIDMMCPRGHGATLTVFNEDLRHHGFFDIKDKDGNLRKSAITDFVEHVKRGIFTKRGMKKKEEPKTPQGGEDNGNQA